jgi:prepilin-type N-terminal cleavage/methylation domain-containing protein
MSRAAAPHLLCFGRRAARRAMTLLELLTVITIMSVLMGVTFPTLRAFNEKNKLRATVREIVALMKYARTEAVFGQRTTEVFFDLDKRQFWVDLREPDPRTGEYNPKHKKRQLEEKRSLNQDLWFDEVTTYDDNIIGDKLVAVDFFADGSASPLLLTVSNRDGSKLTIEVVKSTGRTEVTPGTIADKRAANAEAERKLEGATAR